MTVVAPTPNLNVQFFDNNGNPLAGGLYYTWQAGSTSIAQTTYQDALGTIANTNPVTLDGNGRASIFFDTSLSYHIQLFDSSNTTKYIDQDNVTVAASGSASGLTPVYTTTNQSVAGVKAFNNIVGFGSGGTSEYNAASLQAVFGAQSTTTAGAQIVGTTTLNLQMGTAESGVNSFLAGLSYATGSSTLTVKAGNSSVATITPSVFNVLSTALQLNGANVITTASTVPISSGGTGQTTAAAAINALLPSQTGNSGKFLTTNGSVASWSPNATNGTGSMTTNGYMTIPLVISGSPVTAYVQWGFNQLPGYQQVPVTFPIAFPNACFVGVCSTNRPTNGSGGYNHVTNITKTGMLCIFDLQPNGYSGGHWIAIGW